MYIQEKLKSLGEYIKCTILEGEFELIHVGDYVALIRIEERYDFEIWIANTPEDDLKVYLGTINECSIRKGLDIDFSSAEERLKVWNILKPMIDKYKKEVAKKELEEQAEIIQEKLNKLNNE